MNEKTVRLQASPFGEVYKVVLALSINGMTSLEHIYVRGVSKEAAMQAAKEYVTKYRSPESVSASIEQVGPPNATYLEVSNAAPQTV